MKRTRHTCQYCKQKRYSDRMLVINSKSDKNGKPEWACVTCKPVKESVLNKGIKSLLETEVQPKQTTIEAKDNLQDDEWTIEKHLKESETPIYFFGKYGYNCHGVCIEGLDTPVNLKNKRNYVTITVAQSEKGWATGYDYRFDVGGGGGSPSINPHENHFATKNEAILDRLEMLLKRVSYRDTVLGKELKNIYQTMHKMEKLIVPETEPTSEKIDWIGQMKNKGWWLKWGDEELGTRYIYYAKNKSDRLRWSGFRDLKSCLQRHNDELLPSPATVDDNTIEEKKRLTPDSYGNLVFPAGANRKAIDIDPKGWIGYLTRNKLWVYEFNNQLLSSKESPEEWTELTPMGFRDIKELLSVISDELIPYDNETRH